MYMDMLFYETMR